MVVAESETLAAAMRLSADQSGIRWTPPTSIQPGQYYTIYPGPTPYMQLAMLQGRVSMVQMQSQVYFQSWKGLIIP